MTECKYKIGDRVRIDPRLNQKNRENRDLFDIWFGMEMVNLCVKNKYVLIINGLDRGFRPTAYNMDGLLHWVFTEDMILGLLATPEIYESLCKSCIQNPCSLSIKQETCAWLEELIDKAERILWNTL